MFLCFFQTVLFSSFSGILSLICFTNCPQALWCFTCVHLFLSPLSVYKKTFPQKNIQRAQGSALSVSSHFFFFFFFFPLNFYVMCFRFPAFLGGDVTLWIWSLYLNLMDSCGFWAVTRERFYIKPSLWSWEILRRTLQLCSPKKKLHFPCCLCMQHQHPDCRTALMLWFLHCHRFVSPPRCHGTLNQEDSFWSQALQDLETCGQSEILRELEVGPPVISIPLLFRFPL